MRGADFISFPSNQVDENSGYKLGPIPKTKLLDHLLEPLLSHHSLVTNLIEDGYDIWKVQEPFLGDV